MNCFIPLNLIKDPLKDSKKIFDQTVESIITSISISEIKDEVITILNDANLPIEQVIIWNWKLLEAQSKNPHTDGNYFKEGSKRLNGINWLMNQGSVLDFWDVERNDTQARMEETGITRYTFWDITCESNFTWDGNSPALINPQVPHRVRSIGNQTIRQSVIVSLDNNLTFTEVAARLSKWIL